MARSKTASTLNRSSERDESQEEKKKSFKDEEEKPEDDPMEDGGDGWEDEDDNDDGDEDKDDGGDDNQQQTDDGAEDDDGPGNSNEDDTDSVDLYEVFGVTKAATAAQIKKAFHRLCLKFHPDKLSSLTTDKERAEATKKFQELNRYYSILSDPVRRKRYDETGYMGEAGAFIEEGFRPEGGWDAFFRGLWEGLVTLDKISEFELKYRGSEQEKQDVIQAYIKHKGNMDKVLDSVFFTTWEDEARFKEMVQAALDEPNCSLKRHESYFKIDPAATEKRRKRAEKEAKAFERSNSSSSSGTKKSSGKRSAKDDTADGDDESLAALQEQMLQRKNGDPMAELIARLEAKENLKRGSNSKKSKTGKGGSLVEPTDEEFEAMQKKLFGNKATNGGKVSAVSKKESSKANPNTEVLGKRKRATARGKRIEEETKEDDSEDGEEEDEEEEEEEDDDEVDELGNQDSSFSLRKEETARAAERSVSPSPPPPTLKITDTSPSTSTRASKRARKS